MELQRGEVCDIWVPGHSHGLVFSDHVVWWRLSIRARTGKLKTTKYSKR